MDIVLAAGKYFTWGVVSISLTNLLVIALMVLTFVLALVLPFPSGKLKENPVPRQADRR